MTGLAFPGQDSSTGLDLDVRRSLMPACGQINKLFLLGS